MLWLMRHSCIVSAPAVVDKAANSDKYDDVIRIFSVPRSRKIYAKKINTH
jgi:hypothetical protein